MHRIRYKTMSMVVHPSEEGRLRNLRLNSVLEPALQLKREEKICTLTGVPTVDAGRCIPTPLDLRPLGMAKLCNDVSIGPMEGSSSEGSPLTPLLTTGFMQSERGPCRRKL